MPKFLIEIRNPQYKRIGAFEQYTRFEAIIRFCDVGSWTVTVDATRPEANLLVEGGGIIVWADGLNTPLFSGPVKTIIRKWSAETPGVEVTFSGKTDELWLMERVVYPDPTEALDAQTKDRQTGTITAGGALGYLTYYNLGEGALPNRIHPYVIVDDLDTGPVVSLSARFDPLGEYMQKLATSTGYGFQMVHQGEKIRFRIFQSADRSGTVVFSPDLGNLQSYDYTINAPEATNVVMAAQGVGRSRYLREYAAATMSTFYDDASDGIKFTGAQWTHTNNNAIAYGNTISTTAGINNTASLSFNGRGIAWRGLKENSGSFADVYIDDVFQETVSCYTPGALEPRQVLWQTTSLTPGNHEIRIVKKDSNGYITLDYFEVFPSLDPTAGSQWGSFAAERFADRRDIPVKRASDGSPIDPETSLPVVPSVLAELDQAGTESLLEASATASLSVTPIDTETVKFGRDYQLGDVVSVSINGVSLTDVLREVRLVDTIEEGPRVHPTVGSADASETPYLYRKIKQLEAAIKKLEARF